jgi:hypothetical protein
LTLAGSATSLSEPAAVQADQEPGENPTTAPRMGNGAQATPGVPMNRIDGLD